MVSGIMTRPPHFSDPTSFPAFCDLPAESTADDSSSEWWLLGQVKENMTITKPTLVVSDRNREDFAVTFEDLGVDLKPWKKGSCLVVPRARRRGGEEGRKKGFVSVPRGASGDVRCVPGGWEVLKRWEEGGGEEDGCGGGCGERGVRACTGCECVKYCGKVSYCT